MRILATASSATREVGSEPVEPLAVARVPEEVREGKLRVELDIVDDSAVSVPLQHGMTGTVEVQVQGSTCNALATVNDTDNDGSWAVDMSAHCPEGVGGYFFGNVRLYDGDGDAT